MQCTQENTIDPWPETKKLKAYRYLFSLLQTTAKLSLLLNYYSKEYLIQSKDFYLEI